MHGGCLQDARCFLFLRGIKTMWLRVSRAQDGWKVESGLCNEQCFAAHFDVESAFVRRMQVKLLSCWQSRLLSYAQTFASRRLLWLWRSCRSDSRHPMIKEVFFPGPGGCSKDALRPGDDRTENKNRISNNKRTIYFAKNVKMDKLWQNEEVVLRS